MSEVSLKTFPEDLNNSVLMLPSLFTLCNIHDGRHFVSDTKYKENFIKFINRNTVQMTKDVYQFITHACKFKLNFLFSIPCAAYEMEIYH